MKNIRVFLNHASEDGAPHQRLRRMEEVIGLTPAQIGQQVAVKMGTKPKTEAALYGFFRRGERAISESRIVSLAEVLGVTSDELHEINRLRDLEQIQIDFDPDIDIEYHLRSIPHAQVHTLRDFLLWLATRVGAGESG